MSVPTRTAYATKCKGSPICRFIRSTTCCKKSAASCGDAALDIMVSATALVSSRRRLLVKSSHVFTLDAMGQIINTLKEKLGNYSCGLLLTVKGKGSRRGQAVTK